MNYNNKIFLGIDTSCYTTSIAAINLNREILFSEKIMLSVKKGSRGLRQSEAVYQHINNLAKITDNIREKIQGFQIEGVCVSKKPRPVKESYMPVFNCGFNYAKSIANILDVSLFESTHQQGHIESAYFDTKMNQKRFLCVHMSGGTTEILLVNKAHEYDIQIVGATKDISCGQLIDRLGVRLGYGFPCGEKMDRCALENDEKIKVKVCVNDGFINLSGAETSLIKEINMHTKEYISAKAFTYIKNSILNALLYLSKKYGIYDVLFVGGVSSSTFLSKYLKQNLKDENINSYWTVPEYATDNALGIALIGLNKIKHLKYTRFEDEEE